ncbi:hypothetical protein BV25DRAFT_1914754 [Artomyces pyxidatus]|uniref:Uncharacterized protein n=1 Tax=Artomyces pyxidatus TaxID=48021 RepID=A0ACB8T779_9AGAM|nr:hypothetical protein BV25DRAFT_1914754 [Artomyces pyxidatus]
MALLVASIARVFSSPCVRIFARTSHTNTDAAPLHKRPRGRVRIRTLNPEFLQPADFIDLSSRTQPTFFVDSNPKEKRALYGLDPRQAPIPFPMGTQGFLYYHAPEPPEVLGELRFRVTPSSDPDSFLAGYDLKTPHGNPWCILPGVLARTGLHPFGDLLLREQLVTRSQLDTWVKFRALTYYKRRPSFITHFGQPFLFDFSRPRCNLWMAKSQGVKHLRFLNPSFNSTQKKPTISGKAMVCFELSQFPQPVGRTYVVMRVVKALSEISVLPEYQGLVPVPAEGELIPRCRGTIWKLDISDSLKHGWALKILLSNAHEWQEG